MLQRNATTQDNNFHHSHLIYHRNHEEQHYGDSEEKDDQEDVKDMETNEANEDFEGSQVMIAPGSPATLANDEQEDAKDMEKQKADGDTVPQSVETNEVKKYFDSKFEEGSQVMIAPELEKPRRRVGIADRKVFARSKVFARVNKIGSKST